MRTKSFYSCIPLLEEDQLNQFDGLKVINQENRVGVIQGELEQVGTSFIVGVVFDDNHLHGKEWLTALIAIDKDIDFKEWLKQIWQNDNQEN